MDLREQAYHILDQLPGPMVEEVVDFAEFLRNKHQHTQPDSRAHKSIHAYMGSLAHSPRFSEDAVKIQRAMRNEWT